MTRKTFRTWKVKNLERVSIWIQLSASMPCVSIYTSSGHKHNYHKTIDNPLSHSRIILSDYWLLLCDLLAGGCYRCTCNNHSKININNKKHTHIPIYTYSSRALNGLYYYHSYKISTQSSVIESLYIYIPVYTGISTPPRLFFEVKNNEIIIIITINCFRDESRPRPRIIRTYWYKPIPEASTWHY